MGLLKKVFAITLLCLCGTASAEIVVLETATWGGSTYHILSESNWADGEAMAVELGGHLLTVSSEEENAFIHDLWGMDGTSSVVEFQMLWIGLNDAANEGVFEWSSGESFDYSNFAPGEPNDSGGNEDYVTMWSRSTQMGTWNDYNGSRVSGFYSVVEINNSQDLNGGDGDLIDVPVFGALSVLLLGGLTRRKSVLNRQ